MVAALSVRALALETAVPGCQSLHHFRLESIQGGAQAGVLVQYVSEFSHYLKIMTYFVCADCEGPHQARLHARRRRVSLTADRERPALATR